MFSYASLVDKIYISRLWRLVNINIGNFLFLRSCVWLLLLDTSVWRRKSLLLTSTCPSISSSLCWRRTGRMYDHCTSRLPWDQLRESIKHLTLVSPNSCFSVYFQLSIMWWWRWWKVNKKYWKTQIISFVAIISEWCARLGTKWSNINVWSYLPNCWSLGTIGGDFTEDWVF